MIFSELFIQVMSSQPHKSALYGILPQNTEKAPSMVLLKPISRNVKSKPSGPVIELEDDPEWTGPRMIDFKFSIHLFTVLLS